MIRIVIVLGSLMFVNAAASQARAQHATGTRASAPPASDEAPPKTLHEDVHEVNIAVGETATIAAQGVQSYALGSDGVADVTLTPNNREFVVVGESPGATTLLLLKGGSEKLNYTINVFQRPVATVERELLELLQGTPGIRVRRVGARFFIEGGVSTEPELARIGHIASLFPGQVDSLVVLGGAAAERRINIRIDFFFMQFDRSRSHQVGVSYPGQIAGPGIAAFDAGYDLLNGSFTAAAASVVNQPLPGLDLAASKGWAKVLKHSTVITSNGSEARFSSGGEQNFVVTSGLSAAMTALPFGTGVTVLPRFDPATRELEVRVEAEVSDLTAPASSGTDVPGRDVSSLKTLVSLKLGQSIVLSGIRTRTERQASRGLPLLSQLPLLGALFGSQGGAEQEVEGAILIVPSVVESIPQSAQEVVQSALSQFDEYDGDSEQMNLWEKIPPTD